MGWAYLLLAGLLEVAGTTIFRFIDGWSKPLPIIWFAASSASSVYLLYRALETVPLGTAYAVWTGLGAAGTAAIGMMWFGEPSTPIRIALLVVLIGAIMGLKLVAT